MTKSEDFNRIVRAMGLLVADMEELKRKREIREERKLRAMYEPQEYQLTIESVFSQRFFIALAKQNGVTPYRQGNQRKTTVMVKMTEPNMKYLWAKFQALNKVLLDELNPVTDEFVAEALAADRDVEAEEPPTDPQTAFEGL
jgi:hypothetical protein